MSKNKRFLSYYRPYRGMLAADILCSMAVAAIALVIPLVIRQVTAGAEAGTVEARTIVRTGGLLLALIGVQALCAFYYDYFGHKMGAYIERDMRQELFDHLQTLPSSFYDTHRTGGLLSRITNDLLNLAELYHHGPEDLIIYLLEFLGALVILFSLNASLTLVVLAFVPVMAALALFLSRKLKVSYRESREAIAEVNCQVEDSLQGIRVVKSFVAEEAESAKFAARNRDFLNARARIYRTEAYFTTGMEFFLTPLMTAAVLLLGGLWVSGESLGLTDLITFLLYIGYLTAPIHRLTGILQLYQDGVAGFNRFVEVMDIPSEADDPDAVDLPPLHGAITLQNVSFLYNKGQEVLRDLSFTIAPGETVAVVGGSGVGKTTLLSLIPRFYEVTGGTILLDGFDIRRATLASLRRQIGVVQQDVYLFAGTIYQNIAYGLPDANPESVAEAARRAGAHEFISALPQGYHTDIGQRGVRLSGGQRQKLAIARVFLKNPAILILDEATSSLDNESERQVQTSLAVLAEGRTTLIVAHRLSTVRHADRILVLTEHGIAESGAHDELMARNGLYAALYNAQL